jgi:hypothetical protein
MGWIAAGGVAEILLARLPQLAPVGRSPIDLPEHHHAFEEWPGMSDRSLNSASEAVVMERGFLG